MNYNYKINKAWNEALNIVESEFDGKDVNEVFGFCTSFADVEYV